MKKLLFFFALLLPIGAWASKIPYAVYNNGTLTFKYGEFTPNGITSWDVSNTGSQPFLSNDLSWDGNLKYVVFESSFSEARPKSCFGWFDACKGLESIVGLEYLNTSEVTTMACMFELCPKLKSINLSHFNTSKVTDMKNMFAGTTGITTLDLSSFNTSKVTNMDYMFDSSQNESPDGINWLRVIYVGNNWSTASVISGTHMFDHCGNLSGGNGTRWSSDHIDYTYACIDTPNTPGYLTMVDNISYEGNGTKEDPWLISSVDELRAIHFPGYYKLTKDIDMTEWIDSNSPVNGWPGFVRQYISGIIFDGDNHRITGLWGKRDNFMYGNGLFPQLQDSTIKNLYVEVQKGKSLSGVSEISILTTFIFKNGIIENVKVKGKLELAGTYICPSGGVGGLGSSISNSKIINSEAEVEISDNNPENDSETDYGLLAGSVISGENGESIITGCRASGKISSSWSLATIGGLVGFSTATITKCSSSVSIYSTGDDSFAGGLIGADNLSGGSANISLCSAEGVIYVHGKKSGTFQFGCQAGGLVGYLKGSVTDCTSNVDVMGTDYIGGVVGYCSGGNIRNCLTTGNLFSRAEQSNIGGIVGYIQGNPVINGNVALVRSIDAPAASPDYVWKIAGRVHESTLFPASNVNYALTDMIITTKNGRKVDTNIRYDGISATAEDLHKQGAYIALGWDFDNNWQMAPYNLPEIRSLATPNTIIEFADANVKALCVSMWDTNNDGEISRTEAAAVTDLGEVFKGNRDIIHFDELRFFTGIKEMPEWGTFADCENLYSITIPASVNSLGGATFANCRNLEEINVDTRNSVYDSRLGCNAIIETATNTLVVGGPRSNMYNVKTIGPASFWGRNVPILDYVIPETVTSIGANAFTWSSIEEFSMPTTIEDIGFQAFGYTPLKSITLPSSLSTLGEEAFRNCEEMTSVTIPDNLEEIPDSCFKYCTKLESIDLKNVKKIGGGAFGSTGLTSLVLPASVKEVCHEAFCGCPITTLDLGQVEKVGDAAFIGTAMEELTIPATLIEAGAETFSWNFSMKKAIFQDGCTKVFDTMFHGNENLSEVVLPNTITEIQDRAFRACKSLSTVAWPNKLERIGEQAFQESGITSVVLPQTMKWIGNQAFQYCNQLAGYVDLAYIEHLGYNAFSDCPLITMTSIPPTIVIDEYSWAAFSPSGLETVEFFEGTTRIDNLTFAGCENLKNLPYGLPSTLESIGHNAFTECKSLESVTIPKNVNWIQEYAFSDCTKLTSVISRIPDPTNMTFEDGVFTGISENAVLYVPKGTISAYNQKGWSNYFAQVLEEPDNTLYPKELSTRAGKQPTLAIAMDNDSKITAIQFDLVLPDGITVATDEGAMIITLGSRATKSHTYAKRIQDDGSIRIVISSNSSAVFSGNTGSVLLVKLNVSKQMADGDYDVTVRNIELSSENGVAFHPEWASATITVGGVIMGDVDSNGSVTVNNAVWIVRRILNNTPAGFIEAAADLDGSGTISINDKVVLINHYILGKNKAATRAAAADNNATLSLADFDMVPGQTRTIEVMMSTTRTDIEALQCDIYLPEGLEFVPKEEDGELFYAEKGGRATNSHSISSNIQEDGALRVVESSDEGAAFRQNDKSVFTITVKAKDDAKVGKHTIRLANMELSYGQPINPADVNVTISIDKLGDVNNDSEVNQSDISALAELILSGTYKSSADLNGDGIVNAVDLVLLTNKIK